MGRPLVGINWEEAEELARMQCTQREIASWLKINVDTLADRCKREFNLTFSEWFKKHSEGGKASLRRSLWLMATGPRPNAAVAIWLSKNYLGMKDDVTPEKELVKKMLAYSAEYLQGKNEQDKFTTDKPE